MFATEANLVTCWPGQVKMWQIVRTVVRVEEVDQLEVPFFQLMKEDLR